MDQKDTQSKSNKVQDYCQNNVCSFFIQARNFHDSPVGGQQQIVNVEVVKIKVVGAQDGVLDFLGGDVGCSFQASFSS